MGRGNERSGGRHARRLSITGNRISCCSGTHIASSLPSNVGMASLSEITKRLLCRRSRPEFDSLAQPVA